MAFPVGELASLGAACSWAIALNLFRRDVRGIGARAVNLFKGAFASVLFLLVLLVTGVGTASPEAIGALALSGVIGLALGDTFFFVALGELGAHRMSLFGSLGPVVTVIGGWLLLGEELTALRLAGIFLAVAGVVMVVYARPESEPHHATRRGVVFGLLGAFCQSSSVLLAKRGQAELGWVEASTLRLVTATAVLALFAFVRRDLGTEMKLLMTRGALLRLVPAAFIGTFMGIGLMQLGIDRTESAVANALHSTIPLFTLPIAIIVLKERPGALAVAGSLVAVAGVTLLLLT